MSKLNQESHINLALLNIRANKNQSVKATASRFKLPRSTLRDRINGTKPRSETRPNCQKLDKEEEEAIVKRLLYMDDRGYSGQIKDVEEMANSLLASRNHEPVGSRWAQRFVKRRKELKTRFSRAYDFQRALCEDPQSINEWFRLVTNMRAKYGIQDQDFYNFDETGFMMGIISGSTVVTGATRQGRRKKVQPGNREWATAINCVSGDGYSLPPFLIVKGAVHIATWYTETGLPHDWAIKPTENGWTTNDTALEWLEHFEKHTKPRQLGVYRMIVLDGHASHMSVAFDTYCLDRNIISISLPPHSSHLTQPLDVGVFGPLKRAYGDEINVFVRAGITHITKDDFFSAYHKAYDKVVTKKNIQSGFRGAGLIPHNPDAVLSKLDIKIITPEGSRPTSSSTNPWVSCTPSNPTEAVLQSTLVRGSIARHQSSSPTKIFEASEQMARGFTGMAHQVTLMQKEIRDLRAANQALSKRRRAKKTRVRKGGALTIEDAQDIIAQKEANTMVALDKKKNPTRVGEASQGVRRCGNCGETGHNMRTCQVDIEITEESSSEE